MTTTLLDRLVVGDKPEQIQAEIEIRDMLKEKRNTYMSVEIVPEDWILMEEALLYKNITGFDPKMMLIKSAGIIEHIKQKGYNNEIWNMELKKQEKIVKMFLILEPILEKVAKKEPFISLHTHYIIVIKMFRYNLQDMFLRELEFSDL